MKKSFKIVLLGATLLTASACSFHSGPKGTAKEFFKALADGNSQKVDSMVYWGSAEEVKDHPNTLMVAEGKINSAVKSAYETAKSKGGVSSIKVTNTQMTTIAKDNVAIVTVEFIYGNGETHTESGKFVKKNGKWLALLN